MITIDDRDGALAPADQQLLRDKSNAYPFDTKILLWSGASNKAAFQQEVARQVTGPHTVAIGVDVRHHTTFVRGSADLGLPNGDEVAKSGNSYFKHGDLVAGLDAIAARASDLRVTSRTTTSQASGAPIIVHEHTTSAGVWWLLGGVSCVVLLVAVVVWWQARARDRKRRVLEAELESELADQRIRNHEESSFDARLRAGLPASYTPYSAAPSVVVQQSNNDFLTGLLVADALNPRRDTTIIERSSSGSSSGSSWGSDSSPSDSSSSSDWGSSSDSSSSSDWGGGGSDGGSSGGSDW